MAATPAHPSVPSMTQHPLFSVMRQLFTSSGHNRHMGFEIDDVRPDYCSTSMTYHEGLGGGPGAYHGGVLASLLDATAGVAVFSEYMNDGVLTVPKRASTVDLHINYVLPARSDQRIRCEARILRRGKRLVVVRGDFFDSTGTLIATGTLTFSVLRMTPEEGTLMREALSKGDVQTAADLRRRHGPIGSE